MARNYFEQGFEEGTTDYLYTRDHLGSIREVVANDGTTVASRVSYDPWGKATETGSGALSDFTYTGHYFDRPTGLPLTWFRGLDPNLGRWLSRDPIGLRGGWNLYAYVRNEPVRLTDPTGELPWGPPNPGPKPPSPPKPKPWCPADPEPEAVKCTRDTSKYSPTQCYYNCDDGTKETRDRAKDGSCLDAIIKP
jgi:RHS repeat-associated protein